MKTCFVECLDGLWLDHSDWLTGLKSGLNNRLRLVLRSLDIHETILSKSLLVHQQLKVGFTPVVDAEINFELRVEVLNRLSAQAVMSICQAFIFEKLKVD